MARIWSERHIQELIKRNASAGLDYASIATKTIRYSPVKGEFGYGYVEVSTGPEIWDDGSGDWPDYSEPYCIPFYLNIYLRFGADRSGETVLTFPYYIISNTIAQIGTPDVVVNLPGFTNGEIIGADFPLNTGRWQRGFGIRITGKGTDSRMNANLTGGPTAPLIDFSSARLMIQSNTTEQDVGDEDETVILRNPVELLGPFQTVDLYDNVIVDSDTTLVDGFEAFRVRSKMELQYGTYVKIYGWAFPNY